MVAERVVLEYFQPLGWANDNGSKLFVIFARAILKLWRAKFQSESSSH